MKKNYQFESFAYKTVCGREYSMLKDSVVSEKYCREGSR